MTETAFAFTCTQCGDCCRHGGPALCIDEVFKYQDIFITGLRWGCQAVPKKHVFTFKGEPAAAQKMRNHFATFCPASFDDKADSVHVHIYPMVSGYYTERPCPALNTEEGTCNLHHDKPTMCRSVPFDPALPEDMQGIVLRDFGHDCMTKTPAPDAAANVIYRNGQIADSSCKADYERRLAVMQKDQPTIGPLCYFVDNEQSPLAPTKAQLLNCANSGSWIEMSMFGLLIVLLNSRKISPQIAESYLHSQIRLIEASIADALERRRHNERERTALMREYLAAYRNLLDDAGNLKPGLQQIKPAA